MPADQRQHARTLMRDAFTTCVALGEGAHTQCPRYLECMLLIALPKVFPEVRNQQIGWADCACNTKPIGCWR
jgi:hypothetical protein